MNNLSIFTKPLCHFLIHRYMGQYLGRQLNTDQLEFKLANLDVGTASVQDITLNTDYINESLDKAGIKIISLVDGYIKELEVCVPWKKLLNDSTTIKITGLQVTLTPTQDINLANTQELVSSFIGSIASSMDLAKSVIIEEQLAAEADSGGVEQLTSLIDQFISRIKVIFEEITLRIELSPDESGLCFGIEIQIDRMEFLDENLEEQKKNATETITEQPARLYTTTDLNKLLHIQGVRLYTDIWTQNLLIRNNKLTTSQNTSNDFDLESEMASSSNFQSCYSHIGSRSNSNTAIRPSQNSIPPNPIPFAQMFSERHTLRIRVNNNSAALTQTDNYCCFSKRIDIDVFLGGPLYLFLTPTQLMILKNILSLLVPRKDKDVENPTVNPAKFGGIPMGQEQLNRMMNQMQGEFFSSNEQRQRVHGGFTGAGTWTGNDQFYDFSENFDTSQLRFRSNSLNSERRMGKQSNKTASTSTLVERRPDIFCFSVRAPQLVAIITHDDPLCKDYVKQKSHDDEMELNQTIQTIVASMVGKAEHFFETAATLKLGKKRLQEQRAILSALYNADCLRLVANGFYINYSLTSESQRDLMEIEGHLDECDLLECLLPQQEDEQEQQLELIEILTLFSNSRTPKSMLEFCLKNAPEKQHEYRLAIKIDQCRAELDPSIVDRISNLLLIEPCFSLYESAIKTPIFERGAAPLNDKIFAQSLDAPQPMSFYFKCECNELLVNLRIPIADMSNPDELISLASRDYRKRKLHSEYLQLHLTGTELELPSSLLSDLCAHFTLNFKCQTAKGAFIGDPQVLECAKEQMEFFYVETNNAERAQGNKNGLTLKFTYDKRNKSLSRVLLNTENLNRSFSESSIYNNYNDQDKIEGPFSTKDTFHFKDRSSSKLEQSQRLIKAGSRSELTEFAQECRSMSDILFDFSIYQLNLCLPSRKFFEVLYNRFANDLALWTPKSPKFYPNPTEMGHCQKHFAECQSAFAPMEEDARRTGLFDELSDSEHPSYSRQAKSASKRKEKVESHKFSIGFHAGRARIILQKTNILDGEKTDSLGNFLSQFGTELINANFFFVYGFRGDPNLSYTFVTSTNAQLLHKNLLGDEKPYCSDVTNSQLFMLPRRKENIFLNEIPDDHNFERTNDDNFVFSAKLFYQEEDNTKDILLAFGIRNSLVHFRPCEKPALFWVSQFADFFAVADYGVIGYVPPKIKVDLRVHLTNALLGYDHSTIVANSPYQLRLEIGSSYISTHIVENIERIKLDCIFEDINFWMRKKPQQNVKFEQQRFYSAKNSFVKLLSADSIHFVLAYTLDCEKAASGPLIEFACTDQNLTLWLCSDTIVEFINILKELLTSETIKNLMSNLQQVAAAQEETQKSATQSTESPAKEQGTFRRTFSVNEHEHIIKDMVEAAINDVPMSTVPPTTRRKKAPESAQFRNYFDEKFSPESTGENSTDDEFIVINKVETRNTSGRGPRNGIGITQGGCFFQTHFDSGGDFEFVTTHLHANENIGKFDEQPKEPLPLLISCKMEFSTLTIYLFGGADFADSPRSLPTKTYSQFEKNQDNSAFQEAAYSQGGRYRDHTVCVEIKFTKLLTQCEFFDESSPYLSTFLIRLSDFNIIDHLSISQINEMVHRLEIEGQPRTSGPFLKVIQKEDQLREAVLETSLAPIRLNLDQDTFDFLMDFKNELAQGLRNIFDIPSIPKAPSANASADEDVPVMEVPLPRDSSSENVRATSSKRASMSQEKNIYPDLGRTASMSFNDLKGKEEAATNLEDLFSEDDVVLSDSIFAESSSGKKSEQSDESDGETEEAENKEPMDDNKTEASVHKTVSSNKALAAKATFIKDFTFSPACRIRFDYEAKQRIKTDQQGPFLALLLAMANWKKAELVLKEVRVEKGFLGFAKCAQFVIDEWQNDIVNKQLRNVVGGIAVINPVVQLAQGCKDLVSLPLEEYQRQDGQLARGIHNGTTSFGINAATAAIHATKRFVGLIQNVAELTYDILNPNFAYEQYNGIRPMQIPSDFREGFSMACNTVREGVVDTAQTLQMAVEQDRARGGWGVGILRHITPTAIKPIVVASKATSHVLDGLKNQLKPEEHREEMRKWRHNAAIKQGFDHQFRRQSSSSSIQQPSSSSSTGSFNRI